MGILSQNIDTEINRDNLANLGFVFHLHYNAIKSMMNANSINGIDPNISELSKQYSFYVWADPDCTDRYRYKPLDVRYYPETNVTHACYNDEVVSIAGCVIAFQHSLLHGLCICRKVNDIMDVEAALTEIKIYKDKLMCGEI